MGREKLRRHSWDRERGQALPGAPSFAFLAAWWLVGVCGTTPSPAQVEGAPRLYCLLVPDGTPGPGAVALFDVGETGSLAQRISYPTGGSGHAGASDQDLEMDPRGRWLVASNNESDDLTVYSVSPDGALAPVPASPFPAGAGPTSIAFHPARALLYVSHWRDDTVRGFEIGDDGSLSPLGIENMPGRPRDLEVEGGGRHLYVADMTAGVRGYEISDTGALAEMAASPFRFASSRPYEVEVSADGRHLLALDLDSGVAAFDVDDSGSLTLVPGSPLALGDFALTLEVTSNDRHAYVGFPFKSHIGALELRGGALPAALPTAPFAALDTVVALALSPDGRRLYEVTRERRAIQPFSVGDDGSLAPIGDPVPVADPLERVPNAAIFASPPVSIVFVRGDSNHDLRVSITDAIFTLEFLFQGGNPVLCEDGADANDDGRLDVTDAVSTLDMLFRGGEPLPLPGPESCGSDPTAGDALACQAGC